MNKLTRLFVDSLLVVLLLTILVLPISSIGLLNIVHKADKTEVLGRTTERFSDGGPAITAPTPEVPWPFNNETSESTLSNHR